MVLKATDSLLNCSVRPKAFFLPLKATKQAARTHIERMQSGLVLLCCRFDLWLFLMLFWPNILIGYIWWSKKGIAQDKREMRVIRIQKWHFNTILALFHSISFEIPQWNVFKSLHNQFHIWWGGKLNLCFSQAAELAKQSFSQSKKGKVEHGWPFAKHRFCAELLRWAECRNLLLPEKNQQTSGPAATWKVECNFICYLHKHIVLQLPLSTALEVQ